MPSRYPAKRIRTESGNSGRISGPSFLGLNSQPDNTEGVEYLLEDEPTGSGLRKLLLLVILAAILGLLFVQWRSSLKANPKPPVPAKSDPSTPANAPQGSNNPANSVAAGAESPKVAASGANAIVGGAVSETKAPRTEPTALETTSASALTTSSDGGISAPNLQPLPTKPCPTQTIKLRKKPVFLTTNPVLLWCAPSNIFAEQAASRKIANKVCCICMQQQTRAILARPFRWQLSIPAAFA